MNNYSARSIRAFLDNFPSGAWLIFAVDLLHTIGFSIAFPFLALYLHDTRKLPMSVVGTLFLVAGLCTAGTNLVGGMLSDRLGRRRLFISVTSIGVVAYGGLALLIGVDAPLAVIFAVYIAARSILGTINPTMLAIIADITPRNRLAEIYAFVRTGGNVGFALGPAIGGYMLTFLPFAWLLSISAFACAAVAILCFFLLKESRVRGGEVVDIRSTLAVASDRPYLVFTAISVLLTLSTAHLGSTLSVFAVDGLHLATKQYGLLLTTNGIMVAVTQYPVTFLVNKTRRATGLVMGSLFYVAGYLSLGWITGFSWAIVSVVVITCGEVTFMPIASAVIAEMAPPDKRGRYMGFSALSQTLGYSLSPLFGGVLLDHFTDKPPILWGIISLVGFIAAVGFWLWGRLVRIDAGRKVASQTGL